MQLSCYIFSYFKPNCCTWLYMQCCLYGTFVFCMCCWQDFFSSCFLGPLALFFMSAVCAVEINPLIIDYCILLILKDTISLPTAVYPPTHTCTYAYTHTPPYGTFHCCCSHASQMKAILHSVGDAWRMRDWHSFIMVKWRGEKEEALSGRRCHVTE